LDVELPEKAEVIIHELLGNDPLGENMQRYLIDARARFLAPGGRFLPHRVDLYCCGVELTDWRDTAAERLREAMAFERYGLDFSPLVSSLRDCHEIQAIALADAENVVLVSSPVRMGTLAWDERAADDPAHSIGKTLELEICRTGSLNGIAY